MRTDRPNILLITSDQQHFDTLGVDNPRIKTPALDRLARQGMKFNRAYCPNPTCTPTRGSLITGMYPATHGAWTLGTKVPEDAPTVGAALHEMGYATSLIGKAHFQPLASGPGSESLECQPILRDLDFWRTFNDTRTPWYGFDHVELARNHADESHVGQHYAIWMEERGLKNWRDYFQPLPGDRSPLAPPVSHDVRSRSDMHWKLPAELHYTTWTGERTRAQIERAHGAGEPFFCWSSYHDPHPPYVVPEPWASMYDPADMPIGSFVEGEFDHMPPPHRMTRETHADFKSFGQWTHYVHGYHSHRHDPDQLRAAMAIYYGMISFMDHQIGLTLDTLDRLGVADNTLVVFTTDHGHFLGQHGLTAKGPFHYEDVVRIPMLARWPGRIAAGQTSSAIQSLVDYAPTFVEAAGGETPIWMQGVSQLNCWSTGAAARHWAMVENHHEGAGVHLRTFITDRYKLTLYRDRDWGELFDLRDDPHELRNRFDDPAFAEARCELMRRMLNAELEREPTRMPRITGA
ncbi:MAG: sulfatase family protein [Phycisphaerales bacterium]